MSQRSSPPGHRLAMAFAAAIMAVGAACGRSNLGLDDFTGAGGAGGAGGSGREGARDPRALPPLGAILP